MGVSAYGGAAYGGAAYGRDGVTALVERCERIGPMGSIGPIGLV